MHSARRGMGSDVAGSRPYLPGDDVDTIDWGASARLSSARGTRRVHRARALRGGGAARRHRLRPPPGDGALPAASCPGCDKREAMARRGRDHRRERRRRRRGFVGYLDFASGEEPFWRPPASGREHWAIQERHLAWPDFNAPSRHDRARARLPRRRAAARCRRAASSSCSPTSSAAVARRRGRRRSSSAGTSSRS